MSRPPLDPAAPAPRNNSAAAPALLRQVLDFSSPPPERQIFVNRNLRMETIRVVGFDLDWTLADYERLPLERLTFELTVDRLIDVLGYPEELRRLEPRPEFPRRGLLIDRQAGTVLRMNRHRYVGQAYRGRRRLPRKEIIELYRKEPIDVGSSRFYHVDSLFELPETNLYAELIDLAVRKPSLALPEPSRLFDDVRGAIDWVHAEGSLKRRVLRDTRRYLRRDPELGLALERLKMSGRRLILITNSGWEYGSGICSYLFDGLLPGLDSWRQLFDLVVAGSRKPGFFRNGGDFTVLDERGRPAGATATPQWGGVYLGGSLSGLMRLLGCRGEHVLYVGDHIYGDVVSSKTESTWRTALIVRELEEDFRYRAEKSHEMESLDHLRRKLALQGHEMDRLGDVVELYRRTPEGANGQSPEQREEVRRHLETLRTDHANLLRRVQRLSDRIDQSFNPYWGPFFKQGSSKTLFARQLETYACLYTSRVSNFGLYGTHHYYRVLDDPMPHEGHDGGG